MLALLYFLIQLVEKCAILKTGYTYLHILAFDHSGNYRDNQHVCNEYGPKYVEVSV